jgi:hypothetical protein
MHIKECVPFIPERSLVRARPSVQMAPRVPWLFILAVGATLTATDAESYPRIDFRPESSRYAAATEEYQAIWRTEGERISAALENATGLEMEPGPIKAIVYEGRSNSGYHSNPMRMRWSYPPDTKRATLVHELAHRLIADLVPRDFEEHPVIFLFVYDVWVQLWGQEFADEQVVVESDRRGHYDYAGAWRDALALGAEGRAERWSEFLAGRH